MTVTTDNQEQMKGDFKYKKEISNLYNIILMALKATFERVIDKAYHITGNTSTVSDCFSQLTIFGIMQRLCEMYDRENIQEIDAKLLLLNNPMESNISREVMIIDIEDV